jgi:transposase
MANELDQPDRFFLKRAIGIDEVSIRKGHSYRIVVSDLARRPPIWFDGQDRSEASLDLFFRWLGAAKTKRVRLAVMDMWKPFRNSTRSHAAQASILFDKFHVMRHLAGCGVRRDKPAWSCE